MIDDFQNSVIDRPEQVCVSAPDNLLQSEFQQYVENNYYNKICNLEKDWCGSLRFYKLNIDYVKLLTEL